MAFFFWQSGRTKTAAAADPRVWTDEQKLLLAEAIDMYGTGDVHKLAARVPDKKPYQVSFMLGLLQSECRREAGCKDMEHLPLVDLNAMDDLFVAGGTKPKDVMVKWMDYLKAFYNEDPYQYDKFKLIAKAFLVMSECTAIPAGQQGAVDFKKVYYFLYRVFNQYYIAKHHKDPVMTKYLYELLARVMDDIEFTSDSEKVAMYQIVRNWTSVNRVKSLKVYGNVNKMDESPCEEINTDSSLKNSKFKVLQHPMIPSFNPLGIKSKNCYSGI